MKSNSTILSAVLLLFTATFVSHVAQAVTVTEPDEAQYVWDLSPLYASPAAWKESRKSVLSEVIELKAYEGTLGDSATALRDAADQISAVYKEVIRLYVYATLIADEDTRIAENHELRLLAQTLFSEFRNAVSWYDPEVLAVGAEKTGAFLDEEPGLARHRVELEDILRNAPHTLTTEAERVMAAASLLMEAPENIYGSLADSDLPWETVTLSTGESVKLDQFGYELNRQLPNRADRKLVFDTFWTSWASFENTMGSVLNSQAQALEFETRQRNHSSALSRALFEDNLPDSVYQTLVSEVNNALPVLHRYFKLRKRMLNIEDELRYYDIYPPMVQLEKTFNIETTISLTRESIEPLGAEYLAGYDAGVDGQWMHVYPQDGKRSGAYMFGAAYDVHPYVLLNHQDDYSSASTFAHEYGHAVHSVLANKTQPFETAGYSTFVAETAAIMNEMLLSDLVVGRAETPEEKLYYLGEGLESLRGTYFRQTMFAEFELKISEEVGRGNALTGAKLTAMYLDLLKRYHGHDEGVMVIDDLYAIEWAYVPHFYYDFYVFQYSTSIAAASYLAEKIGAGDTKARDAFITMLKAGSSDYPYELMTAAGVDMATPAPYQALADRMNKIMDQMEAILDEMEKQS